MEQVDKLYDIFEPFEDYTPVYPNLKNEEVYIVGGIRRIIDPKNKDMMKRIKNKEKQKTLSMMINKLYSDEDVAFSIPNKFYDIKKV